MNKSRNTGIIFTLFASALFLIAIIGWINLYKEAGVSEKQVKKNEVATYQNLNKIASAQKKYITKDWDHDGKYQYSFFLVHLWRTITSKNGDSKKLGFIPKKLGFATESSFAVDGYVYTMLYYYAEPDNPRKHIDYTKKWAVSASPLSRGQTGWLSFIIDQSGNILASESQMIYNNEYPFEPLKNGWYLLHSVDNLYKLQENIEYTIQQ